MERADLRLADLLAARSVTTDLAMEQPEQKAIRACVVATEIARRLGLSDREISDVYHTTLLKHLGGARPRGGDGRFWPVSERRVRLSTD